MSDLNSRKPQTCGRGGKFGLFFCVILLMIGCSYQKKQEPRDRFYANTGGWGEMRVPLIKPFYLFCYDGENWMVEEDGGYSGYRRDGGGCSISNVRQLKTFENIFLFRSYGGGLGVIIKGERQPNGWFIIDIDNKTFNGYTDYKEFKDTLHTRYQIVIDTSSWRTPRSYYEEFKKERFMPWFPQQIPP